MSRRPASNIHAPRGERYAEPASQVRNKGLVLIGLLTPKLVVDVAHAEAEPPPAAEVRQAPQKRNRVRPSGDSHQDGLTRRKQTIARDVLGNLKWQHGAGAVTRLPDHLTPR